MFMIAAVAAFMTVSGCDEAGTQSNGTAVDGLIGKPLVAQDGTTFLFNADGTVGGIFRGENIVGTCEATATEICSAYTAPSSLVNSRPCSTPAITGDTVVFSRRDGSLSQAYTNGG